MSRITKKRQEVNKLVDSSKLYSIDEASTLVKKVSVTKFDASVDLHIRLGIDPRKADQALRGTVSLPNGSGKSKSVLVFCKPEKEADAKAAGADYVGLDEYITKIEQGWTDIDVIIATPDVMATIAKLGRVLGPRNLMPNPKSGTVTPDVAKAVEEVKKGKIAFRVDKFGIVHSSIGRISFSPEQIKQNAEEFISTLVKMKPSTAKGTYMKSISMASTMSPGINIDTKSVSSI
ncbi:MAG: 50S ribosomal protein L1 [Sphingobacteriales bacterium]|jgi:large subunit ribosomal protein L1|nr:50S ribosomal protein L1 [Sphingobacteriales bacterium]